MNIVQNFTDKELKNILDQFYNYFTTGYEFEDFLKPLLESIGLTEVAVTKRSGDGGVDLTAVKNGLVEINDLDSVNYKVQAKRYSPNTTMAPEKIDALRGNLSFNEKGLFITTAHVSDKAKNDAMTKDPSKPVLVIDGIDLMKICIEKQIGFAYHPVFSKSALDNFTKKQNNITTSNIINNVKKQNLQYVKKTITSNDIRCNLFSIPRYIFDQIQNNDVKQDINVVMNNSDNYRLTYSPSRKYLYIAKSTQIMTKYGLLQSDGTMVEHQAEWAIDDDQTVYINIK